MLENLRGDTENPVTDFLAQNELGVFTDLPDHFVEFQFFMVIGGQDSVIAQQ